MCKFLFLLCLFPSPAFAFCPITLDEHQQIVEDHTCERMEALEKRMKDLENQRKRDDLDHSLDECTYYGRC